MSSDDEKKNGLLTEFFEALKERYSPYNPERSENVADYLDKVNVNSYLKFLKYLEFPYYIAVLLLIIMILGWIFSFEIPYQVHLARISLVIVAVYLAVYCLYKYFPSLAYKRYQEVQCPKCHEYIPLYQWQCPQCRKMHTNRHIFANCDECKVKVGPLHKHLQSIKCLNVSCGYELYFHKPYEGGFNEHSFRGEG